MDSYTFGTWLRRRRKALDWTQADLAYRVHCTAAMIRKIEADERKPSRELATALAEQLGFAAAQRDPFIQAARRGLPPEETPVVTPDPRPARARHTLPAPLTSLVNRVRDVAAISAMLARREVRLLTLIGPPGIGKTRLCLQSAETVLANFADGACFVDLAPIHDAALVMPTIARSLDIAESGGSTPLQQLTTFLQDKRLLLALDNLEQVMEAARDVVSLLKASPGVKVLATSRTPLRVYGEHEYAVMGLSLPVRDASANQLLESEAAQLFLARVREHQPMFALDSTNAAQIARVCIRLEGVPLALELGAASLRRMTLGQLVDTLEGGPTWLSSLTAYAVDLPPRQQTLYNAVAWSYSLLDPPLQSVFRQLGVFAGGFGLDSAAAICAAEPARSEDAVGVLAEQNLLVRAPDRWQMLEMIREFALEQMETAERRQVERRHAEYFSEDLEHTSEQELERDYENYRTALRWTIRERDGIRALGIYDRLSDFWETRGFLREGLEFARDVLAITQQVEPAVRIGVLTRAAHLAWNKHEFGTAHELTEQAIALANTEHLEGELANVLNMQARIYIEQGDYARAEQSAQESLRLADGKLDAHSLGAIWAQVSEVALARGKLDDAAATATRALTLLGETPDRFAALLRTNLAEVAIARGEHRAARKELELAFPLIHLHIRRELCFVATLAGWLITARPRDDLRRGVELLGAAERLTERTGAPLSAMYRALTENRRDLARQQLPAQEYETAWNSGWAYTRQQLRKRLAQDMQGRE